MINWSYDLKENYYSLCETVGSSKLLRNSRILISLMKYACRYENAIYCWMKISAVVAITIWYLSVGLMIGFWFWRWLLGVASDCIKLISSEFPDGFANFWYRLKRSPNPSSQDQSRWWVLLWLLQWWQKLRWCQAQQL